MQLPHLPSLPLDGIGKVYGKVRAAAKTTLRGYNGIFRRLAEEHGEVSMLMQRCLLASDGATRRELFTKIKNELLAHAVAEEAEFYGPLLAHGPTRQIASHSINEHNDLKHKLERLDEGDTSKESWRKEFGKLVDIVTHHVHEEEHDLFPKAREVLTSGQIKQMEQRFAAAKERELIRVS